MNKLLLRRLFKKAVACICAAVIALSIVYVIPTLADDVNVWDGNKETDSVQYDGGDGSEEAPFLISNGAQLYKMVSESNAKTGKLYYELTCDIYLNDVSKADWKSAANTWYTADKPDKYCFNGTFDGAGFTVYGLYIRSSSLVGGLFPQLSAGAKIGNLTISDADVSTARGYAGAITGRIAENHSAKEVRISTCAVINSRIAGNVWTYSTAAFAALAIGPLVVENGYVRNCSITHNGDKEDAGAFVGDCYYPGSVTVRNSYSLGTFPVTPFKGYASHAKSYKCKNIYTDTDPVTASQKAVKGVNKINPEDIKGDGAKEKLSGFDFEYYWAVTDSYPILVKKSGGLSEYDVTMPGQVWSGLTSKDYAGGNGTKEDPYLISTGGQLALLVKSVSEGVTHDGEYFKLTHNIILNDTTEENWKDDANQWYISGVGLKSGFSGHFDGDGHIISGMYINKTGVSYIYAGLFPTLSVGAVIEKVGLTNSQILLSTNQMETIAGGIAGGVADKAAQQGRPSYVTFSQCFADSTVSLTGYAAGAMVGYAAQQVRINDCYFTGSWKATTSRCGALLGYTWAYSSFKINNSYIAPQVPGAVIGYSNYNTQSYVNCYSLAFQSDAGVVGLYYTSKMNGEAAKQNMVGFDYDNVWVTREGETPGLKVFEENRDLYSNKHDFDIIDDIHYVTVSFVTYTDIEIEPIVGSMFESLTLPEMPAREGYKFSGWYTDATLTLEFPIDYFPAYDIALYAKWELLGIEQGFEDYPATEYDIGEDYEHYKMSVENFSSDYVRSGARSLHRIGKDSDNADFLLFYEDELQVGKVYKMTFWATTDEDSAVVEASLVHATWPDIEEPNVGVGRPFKLKLKKGEWKQYTCNFTAQSKWVSFRISGGHSIYFDDFFLLTNGKNGTLFNIKPTANDKNTISVPDSDIQGKPGYEETDQPNGLPAEEEPDNNGTNNDNNNDNVNKGTSSKQKNEEENYLFLYIIIGAGVVLVIAASVILTVILRKKKKNGMKSSD